MLQLSFKKFTILSALSFCVLAYSYGQNIDIEINLTAMFGTDADNQLDNPIGFEEIPSKPGSFLVYQWEGEIILLEKDGDSYTSAPILEIDVETGRTEQGLLGLAFHPDFEENQLYYIYYIENSSGFKSVLEERKMTEDLTGDDGHSVEIMRFSQPEWNHNGGQIAFGPDGYLYIGLGDGGPGRDPNEHGQDLTAIFGKILRIDVDDKSDGNYAIPNDNPFVDNSDPDTRKEIYAYGLRNPWRFSFDVVNGDLWVADVGQNYKEEIDLVDAGDNFGWSMVEGFSCFDPSDSYNPPSSCDRDGFKEPVIDLSHSEATSIIGGQVFRGNPGSPLYGVYFFADYDKNVMWALTHEDGENGEKFLVADVYKPSSFSLDSKGNVYVVSRDEGTIYLLDHPDLEPVEGSSIKFGQLNKAPFQYGKANGHYFMELSVKELLGPVQIFGLQGTKMGSYFPSEKNRIDFELKPGVYLVQIPTNKGLMQKKILLN